MSEKIRVLVVDDSALMRKLIPSILARDPEIEVVGTAMDGEFALKKIEELRPDVVTLDLEMPRMDGMETLRLIMRRAPLPVILFSTHSKEGAYSTLKALALGAVDFIAKPTDAAAGHLEKIADVLIRKRSKSPSAPRAASFHRPPFPSILRWLLKKGALLPPPWPRRASSPSASRPAVPTRCNISSHKFRRISRARSSSCSTCPKASLKCSPSASTNAARSTSAKPSQATYSTLMPCSHLPGQSPRVMVRRMPRGDMAVLSDSAPVNGHRPSVDVLFHSVAQEFSLATVGILMTGMGEDGAEGLGVIKTAGGFTIAQSEETCVVSGMPRAAITKGYANRVIALEQIGNFLVSQYGSERLGGSEKSDKPEKDRSEKIDKNDKLEKSERTQVSSQRS